MDKSGKYDVFISHSSFDKEWVRQLVEKLSEYNLNVFFDEKTIHVGQSIFKKINDALVDCPYIFVILTEDWTNSEWCLSETYSSLFTDPTNVRGRIIPIFLKDCEIPPLLRGLKYIDFREKENFENNFKLLIVEIIDVIRKKFTQIIHSFQRESILTHSILPWTLHGGPSLGFIIPELYIEPTIKPYKNPHSPLKFYDWIKEFKWDKNIAIIGSPGIGKSTLIKKLFIDYIDLQIEYHLNYIPLFLTIRDIIEYKKSNYNNFPDFFFETNGLGHYSSMDRQFLYLIDGLDEVNESYVEEIVKSIKDIVSSTDVLWIICRRDFFFNKLKNYPTFYNKFYDILEIQEWNVENDSLKFARDYSIKYNDVEVYNKLIELRNKFPNINNFLKKPFEVTLILYLMSDGQNIKTNTFKSTYNLYKSFYENWLQREQMRISSSLTINDVKNLHRIVAIELYNSRGRGISLKMIEPDVVLCNSNLENIKNDSSFWSLLLTSKNGTQDIIERFWHETFGEFIIAENVIQSFLSSDVIKVNHSLKTVYYNEINLFIREGFQQLSNTQKQEIYDSLTKTYLSNFTDSTLINVDLISEPFIESFDIPSELIINNANSTRIREQILYYLGRLETDFYPPILSLAAKLEPNPLLVRSAILGAILYKNEKLEKEYIDSLISGTNNDILNRSVQLVYFGDVLGDIHTFRDNNIYLWEKVRVAIMNRLELETSRDLALRWWDLRTLYCFFVSREWNDRITTKEYNIIRDSICESKLFSDTRNQLVIKEKLILLELLQDNNCIIN